MDAVERRRLAAKARHMEPVLNVGKGGLTQAVAAEVARQLKASELVKVRLLAASRQASDRQTLAQQLADAAGAHLVEVRGFTVVLYRSRKGSMTRSAGS